jgi:TetR/AcrR family transcriptional repressor of nem operon
MLLERGYNDTGIQDLLAATDIPKGSFYHHFESKEDFALQVIDLYMANVHAQLDVILSDPERTPLERVRGFFERVRESYAAEGYLGCLLGALGQELSGVSEVFQARIEGCLAAIARRIAGCLEEARQRGELPPTTDPELMGNILVDCWEGAALRSRLLRSSAPLEAVLDFYFRAAAPA